MIPMKNQYEQQLNAEALKSMGVPVIKSLKSKYEPIVKEWLENGEIIPVDYPDRTQEIIDMVIANHSE
ncbi:hypothetical protein [Flavobacterium sp. 3HN19-14]|uniref:hypothetical protein n=1 Tax=Flavobacterium sp. 3HN19-14 TaxID=3448133 RepID=UPI003EE1AC2D